MVIRDLAARSLDDSMHQYSVMPRMQSFLTTCSVVSSVILLFPESRPTGCMLGFRTQLRVTFADLFRSASDARYFASVPEHIRMNLLGNQCIMRWHELNLGIDSQFERSWRMKMRLLCNLHHYEGSVPPASVDD